MTTKTATPTAKKPAKPKRSRQEKKALRDRAFELRLRNHRAKNGATFRKTRGDKLYQLLRDIGGRAAELRDMIYDAMDADNETFLLVSKNQESVDSLMMDLNASPRDLDMLANAVENNAPFRNELLPPHKGA